MPLHPLPSPRPLPRRVLLKALLAGAAACAFYGHTAHAADAVAAKIEQAHAEIWRRFIDQYGILLDYTALDGTYPRPTAEECKLGKPNALGWWSATENGSMFNGMYMEALCLRAKRTGATEDRDKARRLMQGLLLLSQLGTPGMMARNVADDGKTPYPMGSNDQSGPGLYGLWRYVHEGMATPEERTQVVARFAEIARVLEVSGWRMPCAAGAPSPYRGSFAGFNWEVAPRLLFLLKAAHNLTGDKHWDELYRAAAKAAGGEPSQTRVEICRNGMVFHGKYAESWTGASGVTALRGLWEMEEDPALRQAYYEGLQASARLSAKSLGDCQQFKGQDESRFLADWRVLNDLWRPQTSEAEAVAVADAQAKKMGPLSPRRYAEHRFVREPVFAAWVVTLCPDRDLVQSLRPQLEAVFTQYDYSRLYYSQFFPVEAAYYRLQSL